MATCKKCGTRNRIGHLDITDATPCESCGSIIPSEDIAEAMVTHVVVEYSAHRCEDCREDMIKVDDDVYECLGCYIVETVDEDYALIAA